ncbi:MAG: hypothetical protein CVU88_01610 [Firmicutes bacterium HGW-Firmicutes-13]|nr:MAG: hypothetical protein CVU88_01610 [Firmicutes bacterium HGW-Firmicutes-13]
MKEDISVIRDSMAALLPIYREGRGNLTKIIKSDGSEVLLNKNIKGVIKRLARLYLVDLSSIVGEYGKILGRTNLIPIPLTQNLILVPLKTIAPLLPGDSAYGYFSFTAIKEIKGCQDKENKSKVILRNGIKVGIISTQETVLKQLKNAEIVDKHYRIKHGMWFVDQTPFMNKPNKLGEEVTRKDLASIHLKLDQILTYLSHRSN